jgi:uncharacterized membrane protein
MSSQGDHVRYAVTIERPKQEVYEYWRNWQNLPKFSRHLISVTDLGNNKTEWMAEGPNGPVTWRAETTRDIPGEQIGWRSIDGSEVDNHGVVQFVDAPGNRGTEVRCYLSFDAPGGAVGKYLAKLTGNEPEQEVGETMRRFKALLECGEIPVVEGQPSNQMRNENMPGALSPKAGLR